jgi:hypothetical protein
MEIAAAVVSKRWGKGERVMQLHKGGGLGKEVD